MLRRVDRLAELGTSVITIGGGEPLLHPDLDQIIRRIRARGSIATLITNGYLLTADRIQRLNRAGLDHLQISIDNVQPDEVSKKSLKVLDRKLQWLGEHAEFQVNINSVIGTSENPEDAASVARRAKELGFATTVGIIHDHEGQLRALGEREVHVYQQIVEIGGKSFSTFAYYNQFQKNLIQGNPNDWKCRAGSRYLYICENGVAAIRLDAARRQLEETTDRVETIAEECGFSGEEQMRLTFIRTLGVPPRDYRKRFTSVQS